MLFEMVDVDPRLELIYGESVRRLDQQAAVVEALRGRTGLLLGAGAVSTSFLGPTALERGGWRWEAWAASACLVVVALLVATILWPYQRWVFSHPPRALLRVYVEGTKPRTIDGMHKWLAVQNDDYFGDNKKILRRMFLMYQGATIALGMSIALWLPLLVR